MAETEPKPSPLPSQLTEPDVYLLVLSLGLSELSVARAQIL